MSTIDVIIPTKNRPNDLYNTIVSISEQTVKPKNIILIDQSDTDNEEYIIQRSKIEEICDLSNLELIWFNTNDCTGLTHARNIGIGYSRSDIICFLDDDVKLKKNVLSEFIKVINQMDVDGVGGVVIEKGLSKASFIGAKVFAWGALRDNRQKIYRKAQDGKLKFPVASQTLSGGAMALKKEVFENNKFDEGLIKYALGEDIEFTSRISRKGYRLVITPNAFIYHYPSPKGRYSKLQFIEAKICSKAYLIERVLSEEPKKSKYIFQYLLYLIGQLISCVIMSAKYWSLKPLFSFFLGVSKVKNRFEGVSFISQDILKTREMKGLQWKVF